jgi:hypothetical protein
MQTPSRLSKTPAGWDRHLTRMKTPATLSTPLSTVALPDADGTDDLPLFAVPPASVSFQTSPVTTTRHIDEDTVRSVAQIIAESAVNRAVSVRTAPQY